MASAAFDINSVSSPASGSTSGGSQPFDINAVSTVAAPAPKPSAVANDPAPKPGFFQPFVDTIKRAVGGVQQDVADDQAYIKQAGDQGLTPSSFVNGMVDSVAHPMAPGGVLRGFKEAGDAIGAVTSPVAGAINVAAEPIKQATTFNGYPGLDINLPLMALGPEAGAVEGAPAAEVAGSVFKAPGPVSKAVAPYAAAVSKGAAEKQAATVLASRASDLPAVQASLAEPAELVPGSQPTTFQQTGDMGLGGLERETATTDPAAFAQRRADQGQARTSALQDLQSGADPNDVAKALKSQFDDLDAQTQAHMDSLSANAQSATQAAGGTGNPEDYGSAVRAVVNDAEGAAKTRERGLWKAVDPDGTLTGNVSQTVQAAKDIAGGVSDTAKPMSGEEAAIFNVASDLPALAPVSDLIDLRSRVSTEMRNELMTSGSSPTYARLTQLRGAIQDNLANTIAQKVSIDDAAVARGTMAPDDALSAKIKGWTDDFRAQRTQALASGDGTVSTPQSSGTVIDGTGLQASGRFGGAASDQRLPANDQPTFDADAAQRLANATAATKARAQTYGSQPISNVLAKAGSADQFRLPDGRVAGQFFRPGSTGFQTMQSLYKAADPAAVAPVIEDYAAHTLRRAAMRDDGTIDPGKFASWQKMFSDSLRALPEDARAKFSTAAEAGQAVDEASAARAVALKGAQKGAIGKVMGLTAPEDVTKTVGQILTGRTAVQDMRALAVATKDDEPARQGLRQAVADFITSKLIGNTEAGTSGVSQIKADAYQTFFKTNRPALNLVFKPDEVAMMDAIARDVQRSNRSVSAVKLPGNSNTAQDLTALKKKPGGGNKSLLDIMGATIGGHFGPIGAVVGGLGTHLLQSMKAAGIARVDELVTTAMLHPNVARELLKKISPTVDPEVATAKLSAALRRANGMRASVLVSAARGEATQQPTSAQP